MRLREIARQDLHILASVLWHPLGSSVEVVERCIRCGATLMTISVPRAHSDEAVSDCARVLNDTGWRFADGLGPLCPTCSERGGFGE